ncbi:glycosyltransferase family 2 protein [Clostridium sp. AM58-1XD]|uniref:glycosyltransferase family 2 protein n=1 Tax=Clostridium sp. AM58-1XD TaxID=2292307 RepID=UPI000E528B9A|nr:glycosyltransferase family 2 protein [Clostridium sp. AM58-1XD]RGY96547.1 glycosyltransferase family 2 protein [Clostridium sp. AM58-1XD]
MPKISVLIPIYNVSDYLNECLSSVINQSEKDLEIICVEDASTDNSLEILEKFAEKDKRIKIIRHTENKGLCQTRKDAVAVAHGEYIMFLDSDDYLSLDACENLYKEIVRHKVDILQFGTELLTNEYVSKNMIAWTTAFMEPSLERIEGKKLLQESIIDRKFNCNMFNKIWRAECCKKAYTRILDGYYISAEDRYATFIITYYAKSYQGIKNQYYHYRMGIGITGGAILDLKRFESRCSGAAIVENIRDFLISEQKFEELSEEFNVFRNDILWDCVDCWHNKLDISDQKTGYEILLHYWGVEAIVGAIGRRYFEEQNDILMRSQILNQSYTAVYYRYIGYSAMDDILQKYINMAEQIGGKICLITDSDAPETRESYLNHTLFHIEAATNANWDQYQNRCREWIDCLTKNKIQKVYYLSPSSHVTLLDELTVRSMGLEYFIGMDEYTLDRQNKLQKEFNVLLADNTALSDKLAAIKSTWWYKLIRRIRPEIKEK